jgi:hypothetical protein
MKMEKIIAAASLLSLVVTPVLAKEFVLSDAAMGKDVGDWSITSKDLGIVTEFSVSQKVLHGGKQEGVRVIDINNGVMQIRLIPTRGMDIAKVKSDDIVLGWDSPVKEIVNPAYIDLESRNGLGWLDGFNEMMVRCGYEWTGHPGKDGDYLLSLHGRAGNTPASKVIVDIDEKAPYSISVKGVVYEKTFKFNNYQVWTEFLVVPGVKSFSIHDELTNLSDYDNEYQIIYHSNFGRPLLEEGALFEAAVQEVSPFNNYAAKQMATWNAYASPLKGYDETVYNIKPYSNARNESMAVLHNAAADKGVSVLFNINQLPVLTMWKNTDTDKQGYVTGIEPGTSYAYNRTYQRKLGLVPTIKGGESKKFDLTYTILDSADAVSKAQAEIKAIQAGREMKILDKPLVKLP